MQLNPELELLTVAQRYVSCMDQDDLSPAKNFLTSDCKDGITHTNSCKQIFKFNAQAKIIKIEHISIPDEIEAFREFYKEVGLS